MKLRQSLANFKRPKLDETFTLKPAKDAAMNLKPTGKEQASEISTAIESMEDLTEDISTAEKTLGKVESKIAKPRTSLGIVEMRNDDMGNLGSLCFRRSLPENYYEHSTCRTSCHMTGGKLRKIYRSTENGLQSARRKGKDLLVRCESIMIFPKVLVSHKEHGDKLASNTKQQPAHKVTVDHREQSDTYKFVANLQEHLKPTKPEQPKEAWNEDTIQLPLGISVKTPETNTTRLPQLSAKEENVQTETDQVGESVPETPLDPSKVKAVAETIQNPKRQSSTEQQIAKNSATTKIIIPFGENELINNTPAERSRSKHESPGGERGRKTSSHKVQGVVAFKTPLHREEGSEGSMEKVGENDEHAGEKGAPRITKVKYLKESSKVNEKSHQGRRDSDVTLDVRQAEMARKLPVAPQYLTLNTLKFPLKRFRIPTGVENELFVGRENYPPKTRTHQFPYSQRGLAEHARTLDGVVVSQQDNDGHERQRQCLKIGGKGLLKASLSRNKVQAEDEGKKRVQFLVHNSRYFS